MGGSTLKSTFTTKLTTSHGIFSPCMESSFLHEMVNLAKDNPYPFLIGGF
jgi:hypothetical protein